MVSTLVPKSQPAWPTTLAEMSSKPFPTAAKPRKPDNMYGKKSKPKIKGKGQKATSIGKVTNSKGMGYANEFSRRVR